MVTTCHSLSKMQMFTVIIAKSPLKDHRSCETTFLVHHELSLSALNVLYYKMTVAMTFIQNESCNNTQMELALRLACNESYNNTKNGTCTDTNTQQQLQ